MECSDESISQDSPKAEEAISMSMIALANTRTLDEVKRVTGGYRGHWLYLLYRLENGNVLTRPGFIGDRGPGLLSLEDLDSAVKRIVSGDTDAGAASSVAAQIRQGGGVRLSSSLL